MFHDDAIVIIVTIHGIYQMECSIEELLISPSNLTSVFARDSQEIPTITIILCSHIPKCCSWDLYIFTSLDLQLIK